MAQRRAAAVFCFALCFALVGGAQAQVDAVVGSGEVLAPEFATSEFTLDTVLVDAQNNRILVRWDVKTPQGEIRRNQLGQFTLDSDRSIHYKLGMLMLLREALADSSLAVFITIKPGTEDFSLKTISGVALRRGQ